MTPPWVRKAPGALDAIWRDEELNESEWCHKLYKTMKTLNRYCSDIPDAPEMDHFMALFRKHTGIDPRHPGV